MLKSSRIFQVRRKEKWFSNTCICKIYLESMSIHVGNNPFFFIHAIDACDSNPCQNGGLCLYKNGKPLCICKPGYTGNNCSKGMTKNKDFDDIFIHIIWHTILVFCFYFQRNKYIIMYCTRSLPCIRHFMPERRILLHGGDGKNMFLQNWL